MSKPDNSERSIKQPDPLEWDLPSNAVEEAMAGKQSLTFKLPDLRSWGVPSDQVLLAQIVNCKQDSKGDKSREPDLLDKLIDPKQVSRLSARDLAFNLAATIGDTNFSQLEQAIKKAERNEKLTDEEKAQLRLGETADKLMDIAFLRDGKQGLKKLVNDLNDVQGRFRADETALHDRLKEKNGQPKLGATSLSISEKGEVIGKCHYYYDYTADDPQTKDVKERAEKLKGYVSAGKFANKQEAAELLRSVGNDKIGAVLATANYLAGVPDEKGIRPDYSIKQRSRSSVYYAVGEGDGDDKHLRFHWLTGAVEPNR